MDRVKDKRQFHLENTLPWLMEILCVLCNQLAFYPFALSCMTLFGNSDALARPSLLIWILWTVPILLLYPVRTRSKHFLSLLLGHLIVIVFYAVFPHSNTILHVVSAIVGIAMTLYSFVRTFVSEKRNSDVLPIPVVIGVAIVFLFLQHYQGFSKWDSAYCLSLILYFFLTMLLHYLKDYQNFLMVNAPSASSLPAGEIMRRGMVSTIGYAFLGALILLVLSQYAWLKPFLTLGKEMLVRIMRFLFRFLPSGDVGEITVEESSVAGGAMELPEAGEPFFLWTVLEYLAVFAIVLFLLICLYRGGKRLYHFLKERFAIFHVDEEDCVERVDLREALTLKPANHKVREEKTSLFDRMSPRMRVRRLYQNTLLRSFLSKEQLAHVTAREAGRKLSMEDLAPLYEKARYAKEPCTADDVRKMKQAVKSKWKN